MERRRIIKIVGMAYLFAMSTDSALDLVRKPDRLTLGTAIADAGVDHLAINLRQSARPLAEIIEELASEVMPALVTNPKAQVA
jgi:hypothetical protein